MMNDFLSTEIIDVHNHLVPGVDDGADTLEESLASLRALAADGVTRLAVSPHLRGWRAHEAGAVDERLGELRAAFERLRGACGTRTDVPELTFSQELLISDVHTARALLADPGLGLAGTDYALIEFGFDLGGDAVEIVRTARRAGRRPIVAHPERYRRDGAPVGIAEIRSWKDAGARLQVNGGSLLGIYGEESVGRLGWRLVRSGLADLVATDHHGEDWPVRPADVGRALAARGSADQARRLLSENPRRILDDRATVAVAPFTPRAAA